MDAKAQIKQIEVGGTTYNVALCSAVKQRSLLFLLAKYGLQELVHKLALSGDMTASQKALLGLSIAGAMMSRMSEEEFSSLCNDALYKAFVAGSESPITIDHFQNRMEQYMQLVVKALAANFEGFGQFLSQMGVSEDGEAQEQASTQA